MINNCFKKENDMAMVNRGLNSLYKKLFLAYTSNCMLNVLKSLKTQNISFKKEKFIIEYDKEFKNIYFYILNSDGFKNIFANISITKNDKKYLYFLGNCNNEIKEEFLNIFTLDELKNMIEERYCELKIA